MKTLILALLAILLLAASQALAQPTLDADCGAGATIVGTNTAGKVTIGTDPDWKCTLIFPTSRNRACSGVVENSHVSIGIEPIGIATTDTTGVMASSYGFAPASVISYQCTQF